MPVVNTSHGSTSRKVFIALGLAFILHNSEEAVSFCKYPVQSPVAFMDVPGCGQFLWAVSIVTVLGLLACTFALRTKKVATYYFISTAFAVVLLFNVFVPHVILAIYTFGYVAGLASAVLIILPLCILVLHKNKYHYANRRLMIIPALAGLAAGYVLLFAAMGLAGLVT